MVFPFDLFGSKDGGNDIKFGDENGEDVKFDKYGNDGGSGDTEFDKYGNGSGSGDAKFDKYGTDSDCGGTEFDKYGNDSNNGDAIFVKYGNGTDSGDDRGDDGNAKKSLSLLFPIRPYEVELVVEFVKLKLLPIGGNKL